MVADRFKDWLGSSWLAVVRGCVSAWCERADMAGGAGGRSRGPDGSEHAGGSLAGMCRLIVGECVCVYSDMERPKGGPGAHETAKINSVVHFTARSSLDNVCYAEFAYGSGIRRFGAVWT